MVSPIAIKPSSSVGGGVGPIVLMVVPIVDPLQGLQRKRPRKATLNSDRFCSEENSSCSIVVFYANRHAVGILGHMRDKTKGGTGGGGDLLPRL